MLARDDWHAGPDERGACVQVFLSYRRGDVPGHAGRLTDALRQRLGANSVLQDVVAIAPGQDFTAAIDRALDDSDAVLASSVQVGWPRQPRRALPACSRATTMCAWSW